MGLWIHLEVDQALSECEAAAKAGLDAIGLTWIDPAAGLPDKLPEGLETTAALFARIIAAARDARAGIAAHVAEEQRQYDEEDARTDAGRP
jgi:hypothetical protein